MTNEPTGRRRGPRRAVRAPGPVGHENRALLSRLPALPREASPAAAAGASAGAATGAADQPPAARPDREPTVAFRSKDDSDVGWGESGDSNDDRLRRDKPPHW